MAEDANGASHGQTLEQPSSEPLPAVSKRKPDADPEPLDENPTYDDKKPKLRSPVVPDEGAADPIAAGNGHKGKTVLSAVDKGKGILVAEDGEEEGEDDDLAGEDSDSDDESTDSEDGLWVNGADEDTDFDEDPLAEVDLDNILPSRTRRREPPPPGSYLVNDLDEDSDDSE